MYLVSKQNNTNSYATEESFQEDDNVLDPYDGQAQEDYLAVVRETLESFLTIMPTLLGFILSTILCEHMQLKSFRKFILEFTLIGPPTVIFCTVASTFEIYYTGIVSLGILIYIHRHSSCGNHQVYEIGKRPAVFSLLRATAYSGTSVCILAVDFRNFPYNYSKSMHFGSSAMDMGIGLFVVTMGLVSKAARSFSDLRKVAKTVTVLIVLGMGRYFLFVNTGYQEQYPEYGQHLNAFIILGLTKLIGTLFSLLTRSNGQLLSLSLGLLFLHELTLQLGLLEFVLSKSEPDQDFIAANREGLCSLTGCVALYLISMYFAQWYTSKDSLNYQMLCRKLNQILTISLVCWFLTFIFVPHTDIHRGTFNIGYVTWISAVCMTLILIYSYIFELALVQLAYRPEVKSLEMGGLPQKRNVILPTYVESINMNGLVHFLVSNLLTLIVKETVATSRQSNTSCNLILITYMFIGSGVVFILLKNNIRLA